jgi:hypothetical protein
MLKVIARTISRLFKPEPESLFAKASVLSNSMGDLWTFVSFSKEFRVSFHSVSSFVALVAEDRGLVSIKDAFSVVKSLSLRPFCYFFTSKNGQMILNLAG